MIDPAEQAKLHPVAVGALVVAGVLIVGFGVFTTVALARGMVRGRRCR